MDLTIIGVKASGVNSVIDATPIKFSLPNVLRKILFYIYIYNVSNVLQTVLLSAYNLSKLLQTMLL